MRREILGLLCCVFAIGAGDVWADDFFQIVNAGKQNAEQSLPKNWDHKAYLQQVFKYGWQTPEAAAGHGREQAGIAQIKTHIFGEAQGKWSSSASWQLSLKGENEWHYWADNQSEWRSHNSVLRLKDAFVDLTTQKGIWIRAGHQILAWGHAEGLAVTDALSPQDLREPGQAQLQDIREQVPAFLVSTPLTRNSKLIAVATYKADLNRFAEAGEPFDLFAPYRQLGLGFIEQDPESDWETALKWENQFNGGDMSLMVARINDNNPSLAALMPAQQTVMLGQQRQTVVGITANRALGSWLFKSEAAHWQDVPMAVKELSPWPLHDQVRAMAGLEYSGWDNSLWSLEVHETHTESHTQNLVQDVDSVGYVARLRHSAWNDRVVQQWWWLKLANENAHIGRWDVSLEWSDHWTFAGGVVVYKVQQQAALFWPLRHEDSVNLSARYSF